MTETDLAYMAGMIDGEGTVSAFLYSDRIVLRLAVYNCHRGVLDWIESKFGGHARAVKRRNIKHKRPHVWDCGYQEAAEILRLVSPYLIIKKKQADLFIQLAETNSRAKHCGRGKSVPDYLKELRKSLALQLSTMNKTGDKDALENP